MTLHEEVRRDSESEQNPHQRPLFLSGWRRGLRRRQLPPRLLVLPLLQSLSTFFHRACLQTEDLPASGSNRCGGLRPSQSKWIPILKFRRMLAIMQARAAVRTNAHLYTSKNANLFPSIQQAGKRG